MGRALEFARTRDLPRLFAFFGVQAHPERVQACAARIEERFRADVREIERRCSGLRERERFIVLRAALANAYERAISLPATALTAP